LPLGHNPEESTLGDGTSKWRLRPDLDSVPLVYRDSVGGDRWTRDSPERRSPRITESRASCGDPGTVKVDVPTGNPER